MPKRLSSAALAAVSSLLLTVPGRAQLSGYPAVDSAAVARAAWGRAMKAVRADDTATARREVARAASAWPMQPTYLWAAAALAAAAGDSGDLHRALREYAALGLGRDLSADTTMARLIRAPMFEPLVRAHAANRVPLRNSRIRATLPDSTFWPEGVDLDRRTGRLYVSSVRHATVAEIAPDGTTRELWPRHAPGIGAVMSVRVDPRSPSIWITSAAIPQLEGYQARDSAAAAILKVRVADGKVERRIALPPAGNRYLGDMLVTVAGDVFVTDSRNPALFWIKPGADQAIEITSPLLRSPQGIAPSPDGRSLFVADYSHGLLRVELESREVSWLPAPRAVTTLGLDGIGWHSGAIIAIQNNVEPARVLRFQLDSAATAITGVKVIDRNWEIADEPTTGIVAGDELLYVANSQFGKYDDDGKRRLTIPLTAPIILALPLSR